MIKLKDILVEDNHIINLKQFKDLTRVIYAFYDNVIRLEHSKESRGEFLRITFNDYNEAFDFYNKGDKLLSKIVTLHRSNNSILGPKRVGNMMFMVSYKIIED